MKSFVRCVHTAALVSALLGSAAIASAQCTKASFAGRYALHGDGWGLVNFQGEDDLFPVAIVALVESDGAGKITRWDELLLSGAQFHDDGSVIHDGTRSSSHHEVFDSITYEVQPNCTIQMQFSVDDYQDGVHGIIVDGGNRVLTLSEMDGTGHARDIAAGVMIKLDSANAGIATRVEALENKINSIHELLKLVAQRLSIVVE